MRVDDVPGNICRALPHVSPQLRSVLHGLHVEPVFPRVPDSQLLSLLGVGPARCCSPRHRTPFNSRSEGSECVRMTWQAMGLADDARHVIGCHLTQVTSVQNACR